MLRSLFSGISGLRAHQQMLDVTANNIANVNTVGYKTSQTVFEDTLSQLLSAAATPRTDIGGTNPAQVGLGVRMAAISTNFAQGSAQATGRNSDLMLSGDGFFALRNGGSTLYSRAGDFSFDATGRLVNPEGLIVQGWTGVNGVISPNGPLKDIMLPVGTLLPPTATTSMTIAGNLPADTTSTNPVTQSLTTYDIQGNEVIVTASWTKVSANSWSVRFSNGTVSPPATLVSFAANGSTPSPTSINFNGIAVDISGVTNYAGKSTIAATSQNGCALGALSGFTIGGDGIIIGNFTNGLKRAVAQVAVATFNNANGLQKTGNSLYEETVNSGLAQMGEPGAGRGTLQSGSVEMSNVDLGQEFTELIIAQRGFQANSKIISTSDELLQDLVNLKR